MIQCCFCLWMGPTWRWKVDVSFEARGGRKGRRRDLPRRMGDLEFDGLRVLVERERVLEDATRPGERAEDWEKGESKERWKGRRRESDPVLFGFVLLTRPWSGSGCRFRGESTKGERR